MELLTAPNFVIHRTVAGPVPPDAADPAVTNAAVLQSKAFEAIAIYWTPDVGGADTDTMTFRVLYLDERTKDAVTPIWLRGPVHVRHLRERIIVPCFAAQMFVRIDAFSNAGVNLQIHAAGIRSLARA